MDQIFLLEELSTIKKISLRHILADVDQLSYADASLWKRGRMDER